MHELVLVGGSVALQADVMPADEARRVYNRPCSNRPELDAKGFDKTKEAVAKKAADYFACFASRVEVLDVVSQRPILADATAFRARFQTVFRESGRDLQLRVLSRLVFDYAIWSRDEREKGCCWALGCSIILCMPPRAGAFSAEAAVARAIESSTCIDTPPYGCTGGAGSLFLGSPCHRASVSVV